MIRMRNRRWYGRLMCFELQPIHLVARCNFSEVADYSLAMCYLCNIAGDCGLVLTWSQIATSRRHNAIALAWWANVLNGSTPIGSIIRE